MEDDALLLVELEGGRSLSRLLLAADGRAAAVRGLVTLPGGRALVWAGIPHARRGHVTAAMSRLIGVRDVRQVEPVVPAARVVRHRVHIAEAVDVTVEWEVGGVRHVGAGDGPTLYEATRRAITGCAAVPAGGEAAWLTTDPRSGAALAVVRTGQRARCCTGATPESAALAAALAVASPDARSGADRLAAGGDGRSCCS